MKAEYVHWYTVGGLLQGDGQCCGVVLDLWDEVRRVRAAEPWGIWAEYAPITAHDPNRSSIPS